MYNVPEFTPSQLRRALSHDGPRFWSDLEMGCILYIHILFFPGQHAGLRGSTRKTAHLIFFESKWQIEPDGDEGVLPWEQGPCDMAMEPCCSPLNHILSAWVRSFLSDQLYGEEIIQLNMNYIFDLVYINFFSKHAHSNSAFQLIIYIKCGTPSL